MSTEKNSSFPNGYSSVAADTAYPISESKTQQLQETAASLRHRRATAAGVRQPISGGF